MIEECLLVELAVTGDGCPLADATRAVGVTVESRPPQLRADGAALLGFSAPDDDDRLARTLDDDGRVRSLHRARTEGRANFRCLSEQPCVVHDLVSAGLLIEGLSYRRGNARVRGTVVGYDALEAVMDRAGEAVGVRLRRVSPLGGEEDSPVAARWDLTPRQEEALRAAYAAGYFQVPREANAGEVAAELGIGKSAFLERLRRAERSLFAELLD
jgi:predicted DNA binding protein